VILRTLYGCSPFVACGLISTFTEWRTGTLVAFALSVVLTVAALRGDGPGGAVVEISSVVFCGGSSVVAYTATELPVRDFVGALSSGWLALTVWGTLVLHRPYTEAVERRHVADEVRRDPVFRRRHRAMTAIWGTAFTATAAVLAVVEAAAPHSGFVELGVQLAGNLLPAACVARYRARETGATLPGQPPTATDA
jgi:hypothetical protein